MIMQFRKVKLIITIIYINFIYKYIYIYIYVRILLFWTGTNEELNESVDKIYNTDDKLANISLNYNNYYYFESKYAYCIKYPWF